MTGLPQFNYPTFDLNASLLRSFGYEVLAPNEDDSPELRAASLASEHGDPLDLEGIADFSDPVVLAVRNVTGVLGCDGLAYLPGSHRAAGAIHEIQTAMRFEIPVAPVNLWIAARRA